MAKNGMEKNPFGKISSLHLVAAPQDEGTILRDVSFTAPYKIMHPFPCRDGGIRVMLLAASAGMMEGDRQEFDFHVLPGAKLEFISQSYDKIHRMEEGCARRKTRVRVDAGASFYFHPQPVIPFADSAYESQMEIALEDDTARFAMSEILSCGRLAMGEAFAYRFYRNLVEIRRAGKLIYRDNTRYEPGLFDMSGMGMYESFSHLLNFFCTPPGAPEEFAAKVWELLDGKSEIQGGITRLASGDFAVRALGHRAQVLEQLEEEIRGLM